MSAHHETSDILDDLRQQGIEVEGSVQDFFNVDDNVETTGTLTDEEIALMVVSDAQKDREEPSGEDYDKPIVCSTVSECCSALDVVRRFIICHRETSHLLALNCLDELLYNVKPRAYIL